MALSYDLTKVNKDVWTEPEDESGQRPMHHRAEYIIMMSMSVGLGGISEGNVAEWYARLNLCERLYGTPRENWTKPEEIQAYIGLKVNVSPETRASWLKRIVGGTMSESLYRFRRDTATPEEVK